MVIIAAVDKEEESNVVAQAKSLAEAYDDSVHVIHVLSGSEFVGLERTSVDRNGNAIDIDEVHSVARDIALEITNELKSPHEAIGLMGNPAETAVKYAKDHNARYIVIGGRKRSPVGKAIFGSVAQSIILQADCPVVVANT